MTKDRCKMWLETARPKTLPLAVASIVTGASLAYFYQHFDLVITLLALLTATLLQILSNFANDYGDHIKGSDTAERIGPLRGIQKGVISFQQLRIALYAMIVACLISGSSLIVLACRDINDVLAFAGLGVLAIVAAITYTVGKKPYGYMGLGDISVLIFFGLLGVGGTYYLQAHTLEPAIFLPALSSGLLATAVLNINNLRDIEQDRVAGKNTLVVRIGAKKARYYHAILLTSAVLLTLFFALFSFAHWYNYLFILAVPSLIKHAYVVLKNNDPLALRPLLAQMALLSLVFNLLLSIGLLLG